MIKDLEPAPGMHLSIDPGNIGSGWVLWGPNDTMIGDIEIVGHGRDRNVHIRKWIARYPNQTMNCHLEIECPKPRGQPTAAEEMEMMIQIGRFLQMWRGDWTYVFRQQAKSAICGGRNPTDSNVRQALIDHFGGDSVAIGGGVCKKCKGKKAIGLAFCPKCKKKSQKNNDCAYCDGGKDKSGYVKLKCPECEGLGLRNPKGQLHDFAEHEWAALLVGVYWHLHGEEPVHHITGQQKLAKQKSKWRKKSQTSQAIPE